MTVCWSFVTNPRLRMRITSATFVDKDESDHSSLLPQIPVDAGTIPTPDGLR